MRLGNRLIIANAVAAALVLLVSAACGASATSTPLPATPTAVPPTLAPAPTAAAPVDEVPSPTPSTAPRRAPPLSLADATAPLSMEFEGEGSQVLEPFVAANGVLVLMANYEGEGDFVVSISSNEGELEPIIDSPGPYFGNLMFPVFRDNIDGMVPGSHQLNVTADGPWRIRVLQEVPVSGQAPTIQFGGVGDGSGGWIDLKAGSYTIRANHDGESQFKVMFYDVRGRPEVVVIDEPGPFDETITMEVSADGAAEGPAPGIYGIGVLADGIWSLILENADAP